jgi:hypothetical protein
MLTGVCKNEWLDAEIVRCLEQRMSEPKKLDAGQKHMLRLVVEGADSDGWAPVSAPVFPLLETMQDGLIELERVGDEGRGRARLISQGAGSAESTVSFLRQVRQCLADPLAPNATLPGARPLKENEDDGAENEQKTAFRIYGGGMYSLQQPRYRTAKEAWDDLRRYAQSLSQSPLLFTVYEDFPDGTFRLA